MDEIANSIVWNMNHKGYIQSDDQSDMLVNFYVIMKRDSSEMSEMNELVFYDRMDIQKNWLKISHPQYYHFLEGALVINVIDRKSSELIWTSKAVKYLEINPTNDNDRKSIWNGVRKAMKKFPEHFVSKY